MGEGVYQIQDKELKELEEKVNEIGKVIRGLITEIHYTLYKIRRILEEENMLSYEDYYDIRESLDKMTELAHKLDKF